MIDRAGKVTITLVAIAIMIAVLFYAPFMIALPLLAAFGVGMFWLWRR